MLTEIRIEALGAISAATAEFGRGLTVLTGETGAGKTMVLTALEMLLGGRVDSAISEGASIEGVWSVAPDSPAAQMVQDAGGHVDHGEILLGRTATNGRLRAFAGGRMVPASLLSEVGEHLVTIHGQTTQQRLRNAGAQRDALDRFGGPDHLHLVEDHRAAHRAWQGLAAELSAARTSQQENAQRMVFLRSALEEIERIDPQPGETPSLHAELHRLTNLADLSAATAAASAAVLGDDDEATGAAHLLHLAARELAAVDDPELAQLHDRLVSLAEEASEIGRDISGFADGLQDEPGRLEWLNQRLHDLSVLQSRYGADDAAVLQWSQEAAAELTALERGSDLEALTAREQHARRVLDRATSALRASRSALAERLGHEATSELQQLAMPNAMLQVEVTPAALSPEGADDVTFLLAAHPGATPAPIATRLRMSGRLISS